MERIDMDSSSDPSTLLGVRSGQALPHGKDFHPSRQVRSQTPVLSIAEGPVLSIDEGACPVYSERNPTPSEDEERGMKRSNHRVTETIMVPSTQFYQSSLI